jgi:tripartite-type tricarboxylate transporter receptor subunit TctC
MTGNLLNLIINAFAATALFTIGMTTTSATAADFYSGKQIQMIIGADVGGGYDFYGRMVARNINRHIPGNPTIISNNMPGASSIKLATHMFSVAPKDGTVIGAISPDSIVSPMTDARLRSSYDPTKFQYIGTADTGVRVCVTWASSQTKTFEDAQKRKTIVGATSAGGATRDFALFLNALAGTKFEVITGYKGTDEIILALERGEIEGLCGYEWGTLIAQKPDWLRDKKINVLVQMAPDENGELSKMGVPTVWKYLKGEDDRRLMQFLVSEQAFQRPFVLPPGTPKERVDLLRSAFDSMVRDAAFLADAKKSGLNIAPASGAAVQALVEQVYATPAELVERSEAIKASGTKK